MTKKNELKEFHQFEYEGWHDHFIKDFDTFFESLDFAKLKTNLKTMKKRIEVLEKEKFSLQKAGITNGRTHLKDKKFWQIYHPSSSANPNPKAKTTRFREYVGDKKINIDEAEARIERFKRWADVCKELENLKGRYNRIFEQFNHTLKNSNLDNREDMSYRIW